MHTLKTIYGFSTIIAACVALTACSNEMSEDFPFPGDEISFMAYYDGCESTRGAVISEGSLESFNVSAYYYTGDEKSYDTWPSTSDSPNYIVNEVVSKGTPWTTANTHYWPNSDGGRMRFYAFANFPDGTAFATNYTQITDYSVPPTVTDQQDIIAAVSDVETAGYRASKAPVPMLFHHIFTAIRFAVSPATVTVDGSDYANVIGEKYELTSIGLENVYGKGSYTIKEFAYEEDVEEKKENAEKLKFTDNRDYMWDLDESKSTINSSVTFDQSQTLAPGKDITDGENTMMMIPQNNSNVKLVVTLKDKNTNDSVKFEQTLDCDWGMGQMFVYSIYAVETSQETTFGLTYQVCPWSEYTVTIPTFE